MNSTDARRRLEILASIRGHHAEIRWTDELPMLWDFPEWGENLVTCTIRGIGNVPYANGGADWDPRPGDVLACLLMDATDESYRDWCEEYGYDAYDVHTGEKLHEDTYEACLESADIVRDVFGPYLDTARDWAGNIF